MPKNVYTHMSVDERETLSQGLAQTVVADYGNSVAAGPQHREP